MLRFIAGQGRYGKVWKGHLTNGRQIAVKIFDASSKFFYENERDIDSLPQMKHSNIVEFLGYEELSNSDSQIDYR